MKEIAGYREIDHTADWELLVWAPDLPTLLRQSAYGMYTLSGIRLSADLRLAREFEIHYTDDETLIVDFLSELLYFSEEENIGFNEYKIQIEETLCKFQVVGAPILEKAKEIKAVTFHKMKVRKTELGLEINIVFDV